MHRIGLQVITVFFILLTLTASCGGHSSSTSPTGLDSAVYVPEYASGFKIYGSPDRQSTVITVSNPWQGADSITLSLLIRRNEEPVPEGFKGQVMSGNATRIVAMSSTHVAMLDATGDIDKISAVSGLEYISNKALRSRGENIADIGYEGNIDYERIMAINPDIVLLYGVNSASPMEGKLKELGIPFIYVGDYLEESPLGKAEWTVALGEITGHRNEASEFFQSIPEKYNALKQRVAESGVSPAKVMINAPYSDAWIMPSDNSYAVQLIKDAGGVYLYKKNDSGTSRPVDREEIFSMISDADVWINTGAYDTYESLLKACAGFENTSVVKKRNVYNNSLRTNPSGGNDYWESGIVHPELILSDLINIFHPGLLDKSELHYYKPLK